VLFFSFGSGFVLFAKREKGKEKNIISKSCPVFPPFFHKITHFRVLHTVCILSMVRHSLACTRTYLYIIWKHTPK